MTTVQKLQIALSEGRTDLNRLIGLEKLTPAQVTELEEKRIAHEALETQFRAALTTEPEEAPVEKPKKDELAELRALARLGDYLDEACSGKHIDGASKELRTELIGDNQGCFPLEILGSTDLEKTEKRQDVATAAPTSTGSTQGNVLERLFPASLVNFLGVDSPMVSAGDFITPVISETVATTASPRASGVVFDATAATITAVSLSPIRLTARYLYSQSDAHRIVGFEESLRLDLAGALGHALDVQAMNGDGSAPNVNGFIAELTAGSAPPAGAPSLAVLLATLSDKVDGIRAATLGEVRGVYGVESYSRLSTVFGTNGEMSAADHLSEKSAGIRASSILPVVSSIQNGLAYRSGRGQGSAVMPLWSAAEIIVDRTSAAAKGEVALTILLYFNFKVLREEAFSLFKIRTA